MESDDDVLLPSSPAGASPPVRQRKLKRLKKAIRVSQDLRLERSESDDFGAESNSPELEALKDRESEERLSSGSGSSEFDGHNGLDSGFTGLVGEEEDSGAKRALDFESLVGEFTENGEDQSNEIRKESEDVRMEGMEEERRSPDRGEEEKDEEKKKRKRKRKRKNKVDDGGEDENSKETSSNKRRSERVCRHNKLWFMVLV